MNSNEKPPIGLMPRKLHDKKRARDILCAMERYLEESKKIPKSWFRELAELLEPAKNEFIDMEE